LCREQSLQLDWQGDRCRIRTLAGGSEEVLDRPLRKSVFRAVLARVATLCNERNPNSVSPYGGQGELSVGADPPTTFRVTFTNTTEEQKLELSPMPACFVFEQCQWTKLQDVVGRLEQVCNDEFRSAVLPLKFEAYFIRILFKIATKALRDRHIWDLIRQLLVIHNGKYVAMEFGDVQTVRQILSIAEEGDDYRCLIQLENYANQVIACYEREIACYEQDAEMKLGESEDEPPREDDLW
jgi:hypothetical protein